MNRIRILAPFLYLLIAMIAGQLPGTAHAERIRDLGQFEGLRANQLTGYGVVVGLQGTGDNNLEYVTEAMRGVSGRLGLQLPPGVSPILRNAAAVIVTAELPAFAKPGQRIDITVSTLGQALSLRGGALILTPLYGADGQIYAMAQGNVAVGGLGVTGRDGSQVSVNVATVGRIADGASVERAVATGFDASPTLRFNLHKADFLTAARVRDAVNSRYPGIASIADGVSIELALPQGNDSRSGIMAEIEMLAVQPAPVATVSHGKLVIRIDENPAIVQPAPFSQGQTAQEESSDITIEERSDRVAYMPGAASLTEIVDALNLLGVGASDLVVILESLKQAGSLQAEMVEL